MVSEFWLKTTQSHEKLNYGGKKTRLMVASEGYGRNIPEKRHEEGIRILFNFRLCYIK